MDCCCVFSVSVHQLHSCCPLWGPVAVKISMDVFTFPWKQEASPSGTLTWGQKKESIFVNSVVWGKTDSHNNIMEREKRKLCQRYLTWALFSLGRLLQQHDCWEPNSGSDPLPPQQQECDTPLSGIVCINCVKNIPLGPTFVRDEFFFYH